MNLNYSCWWGWESVEEEGRVSRTNNVSDQRKYERDTIFQSIMLDYQTKFQEIWFMQFTSSLIH